MPYEGIYLGFVSMYHVGDTQEEDFDLVETNLQVMCKISWISRLNLLQITLLSTEKILHY